MSDFRVVILAAGMGNRMGLDVPKALVPVAGKPMIDHLLESIKKSEVNGKPLVVVGHDMEKVCSHIGEDCDYAVQEEMLGTGHAVHAALPSVKDTKDIFVLYGDHPFVSSDTIRRVAEAHKASDLPVTLTTLQLDDFDAHNEAFHDFGRIVRNESGQVESIVEKRDATEEQMKITEVNPGYYCFSVPWLHDHIHLIENKNAQDEYYLTDLISIAMNQGHQINTVVITDPLEGIGANSQDQIKQVEELFNASNDA